MGVIRTIEFEQDVGFEGFEVVQETEYCPDAPTGEIADVPRASDSLQAVLDKKGGIAADWELTYESAHDSAAGKHRLDGGELFDSDGESLTQKIRESSELAPGAAATHDEFLRALVERPRDPHVVDEWIERRGDDKGTIHVIVARLDEEGYVTYETWSHPYEEKGRRDDEENDDVFFDADLSSRAEAPVGNSVPAAETPRGIVASDVLVAGPNREEIHRTAEQIVPTAAGTIPLRHEERPVDSIAQTAGGKAGITRRPAEAVARDLHISAIPEVQTIRAGEAGALPAQLTAEAEPSAFLVTPAIETVSTTRNEEKLVEPNDPAPTAPAPRVPSGGVLHGVSFDLLRSPRRVNPFAPGVETATAAVERVRIEQVKGSEEFFVEAGIGSEAHEMIEEREPNEAPIDQPSVGRDGGEDVVIRDVKNIVFNRTEVAGQVAESAVLETSRLEVLAQTELVVPAGMDSRPAPEAAEEARERPPEDASMPAEINIMPVIQDMNSAPEVIETSDPGAGRIQEAVHRGEETNAPREIEGEVGIETRGEKEEALGRKPEAEQAEQKEGVRPAIMLVKKSAEKKAKPTVLRKSENGEPIKRRDMPHIAIEAGRSERGRYVRREREKGIKREMVRRALGLSGDARRVEMPRGFSHRRVYVVPDAASTAGGSTSSLVLSRDGIILRRAA